MIETLGELSVLLVAEDTMYNKVMDQAIKKFEETGSLMSMIGTKTATEIGDRLEQIGAPIQHFGVILSGMGAAITGALMTTAKVYASMGDSLTDMSLRTGMTVEALTALEYAAILSGTSLEGVEFGLRRFSTLVQQAVKPGGEEARKIFSQMNIPVAQLLKMAPEKQLMVLSKAFQTISEPTKRAQVAMELFGRGGTKLLPFLLKGPNQIQAMMKEAEKLGLVLSKEDAEAADEFQDSLDSLWMSVKRMTFEMGRALAPDLKDIADWIVTTTKAVRGWIRENHNLVKLLLGVGVALTVLGGIIMTVGTLIAWMGAVLKGFSAMTPLLSGMNIAWLGWGLAIAAVVLAVVFLTDAILQMFAAGNLGVIDFVSSFQIGFASIGTYFQALWIKMWEIWDLVVTGIKMSFYSLKWVVQEVWTTIGRKMLEAGKGISDGFWSVVRSIGGAFAWLVEKTTGVKMSFEDLGKSSQQLYQEEIDKSIGKSADSWTAYTETVEKLGKAHKDFVKAEELTMARLFDKDERKKQEQASSAADILKGFNMPYYSKQTFKEVNINRYALGAMPTPTGQPVQKVQDFGVMAKLDTLIAITRKPPVAVLK